MSHRTLNDIFPPYYHYLPDNEDISRMCLAHFHAAQMLDDLTRWIEQEHCPYLREAYAEGMYTLIWQGVEQGDESLWMNANTREEVETQLNRIIRRARTDQIAEEMIHADEVINHQTSVSPDDMAHVSHLQQTVAQLAIEVREMKQTLTDMTAHRQFFWPYYNVQVTSNEKAAFEQSLRMMCMSKAKGKSNEIKVYLELKQNENIIVRPQFLKSEHQILHEHFDYRPSYAAYSNA